MASKIVIVDYSSGNVSSVRRSLARVGFECEISSEPSCIKASDKLILAGIGHFETAMAAIRSTRLMDAVEDAVLVNKKPVLGICLGMEMMARGSEEGKAEGFGWLNADTIRFRIGEDDKYKVPHIGWNRVSIKKDSPLMRGIPDRSEFYFMHSYHLKLGDETDLLNEATYETSFVSAIQKDNIFGVQFHPEKSHQVGLQLLGNFADL